MYGVNGGNGNKSHKMHLFRGTNEAIDDFGLLIGMTMYDWRWSSVGELNQKRTL